MASEHITVLKQLVEHGGGIWIAFQEAEPEDSVRAYVLFQAPKSRKLLMLPDDEFFTSNLVLEKVHHADSEFNL